MTEKPNNTNVWAKDTTAKFYLEGTRAATPFASEELEILIKIIKQAAVKVDKILDVGCGSGVLARNILNHYPNAEAIFTDLSDTMIEAAKKQVFTDFPKGTAFFYTQDMNSKEWMEDLKNHAPYDVIVSGFAIHHLTHRRKKEIYGDIYDLLAPNGIFLNLDRVESATPLGDTLNSENYIDSIFAFHKKQGSTLSREEIAKKYFYDPLKQSNILAPVEMQTQWLRELGYKNVDIFFKVFEIAIFGGTKRPLDA